MFTALWVLASMLIDVLTPKELNVYMIAPVIAPALLAIALLYYFRRPVADFSIMVATLWLLAAMAIEWITPKPLSPLIIIGAFAPAMIVGVWLRCQSGFRKAPAPNSERVEPAGHIHRA